VTDIKSSVALDHFRSAAQAAPVPE